MVKKCTLRGVDAQLINMFELGADEQVRNKMLTIVIRKTDAAVIAEALREKVERQAALESHEEPKSRYNRAVKAVENRTLDRQSRPENGASQRQERWADQCASSLVERISARAAARIEAGVKQSPPALAKACKAAMGCEYCDDDPTPLLDWKYGLEHALDWRFCPMCGRDVKGARR